MPDGENVLAFELALNVLPGRHVAGRFDAVVKRENAGGLVPERRVQLIGGPDVERAFPRPRARRRRAVRVFGGVKPAFLSAHVAQDVFEDLSRHVGERLIFADLVRLGVRNCQLRLIVEHLLEVRHAPFTIRGVTVEPSAKMVADAAACHRAERLQRHVERGLCGGAGVIAEQEIDQDRPGKLRRGAKAALGGVVTRPQILVSAIEHSGVQAFRCARRSGAGLRFDELRPALCGLENLSSIGRPLRTDAPQQRSKPGLPVAIVGRKVRRSEKRLQVRGEKHRHRPSAATGRVQDVAHVDTVDIGPFLAIDLDRNDRAVHHLRHGRI